MSTLLEAIEERYGVDHRNADGETPAQFVEAARVRAELADLESDVPGVVAWAYTR